MKKILIYLNFFIVISGSIFCAKYNRNDAASDNVFSHKLFDALLGTEEEHKITKILKEAADYYGSDQDAFAEFMRTRDEAGWDIIMHYAARGDAAAVKMILDTLLDLRRTNYHMFGTISLQDFDGRTALYIAIMRNEVSVVRVLLEFACKVFGSATENKANGINFMNFINTQEHESGWTPLILATYNGHYQMTKLILECASKVFGKNSKRFQDFLTYKDRYGFSAIDYATGRVRDLLLEYGAEDNDSIEEDALIKERRLVRDRPFINMGCRDRYCSCRCKRFGCYARLPRSR